MTLFAFREAKSRGSDFLRPCQCAQCNHEKEFVKTGGGKMQTRKIREVECVSGCYRRRNSDVDTTVFCFIF